MPDLSEYAAWSFQGHPFANVKWVPVRLLKEATEQMDELESQPFLLSKPLAHVLKPAPAVTFWRPWMSVLTDEQKAFILNPSTGCGRGLSDDELKDERIECARIGLTIRENRQSAQSSRERAQWHSAQLSNYVERVSEKLSSAAFLLTFGGGIAEPVWNWGELPPDLIQRPVPLPSTFAEDLSRAQRRAERLAAAVRIRQEELRFALAIVETHEVGRAFTCRDPLIDTVIDGDLPPIDLRPLSARQFARALRPLIRETPPLVRRIKRESNGMIWERIAWSS